MCENQGFYAQLLDWHSAEHGKEGPIVPAISPSPCKVDDLLTIKLSPFHIPTYTTVVVHFHETLQEEIMLQELSFTD